MKGIISVCYLSRKWIELVLSEVVSFNWVLSWRQVVEMVAHGRSDAVIVSEIAGKHLLWLRGLDEDTVFTPLPFMASDR